MHYGRFLGLVLLAVVLGGSATPAFAAVPACGAVPHGGVAPPAAHAPVAAAPPAGVARLVVDPLHPALLDRF